MLPNHTASIVVVLFLTIPTILSASAAAYSPPSYPMAKANCTDKCGNITVPFPFGIGPSRCFLNTTYEVVCNNTNNGTFLKALNLEILEITVPGYYPAGDRFIYSEYRGVLTGTIRVRLPIIYTNCGDKVNDVAAASTMPGTPFYFSQTENIFVSAGCNNLAVMASTESAIAGCSSSCYWSNTTNRYSDCSGLDCCRSSIPIGLQDYNIDFRRENDSNTFEGCKYAFLAEQNWLGQKRIDLDAIQAMDFVPVILDWGIDWASMYQVMESSTGFTTCTPYTNPLNQSRLLYNCYCQMGFIGNAYLNNCEDIDECEDPNVDCIDSLCVNRVGSYDCKGQKRVGPFIGLGIGVGIGVIILFLLALWLWRIVRTRKERKLKQRFFRRNGGLLLEQEIASTEGNYVEKTRIFSAQELEKATDNFSTNRVLGQGGQGTVYKGMLEDGRIVAIKKSIAMESEGVDTFINEVVILSRINHRNIVKILGCCLETEVPLLVYEFVPNGTLYHYIHDPGLDLSVSWDVRMRIASEVAGALAYLHFAASMPIYHRDVKSNNIMLDEKYRAKVADFGTSKSVAIDRTHVTTQVQGTFGYLDPEFFRSSQFTDKSDVYSFGVVLAELLTGQKPISRIGPEEHRGLASYFVLSMEQDRLFEILDPHVRDQGKREEVTEVAKLAARCLNLSGRKRPTMREVAVTLENLRILGINGSDREELDREGPVKAKGTESVVRSWDDFTTRIFTTFDIESSEALLSPGYH